VSDTDQPRETGEPRQHAEAEETVNRESHPNAGGPAGLAGDMGISSEREGPFEGIEGTGSLASVQHSTDGESPPTPVPDELGKADESDPSGSAQGEPTADVGGDGDASPASGVDRTVGEVRPGHVANKHRFDPSKNPGH
jgi:hypothetical protein